MRFRSIRVVLVLVLFSALGEAALGQLPGMPPSGSRIETADVRGLSADAPDGEAGFSMGVAGPTFADSTVGVMVKFQASNPPADSALQVVVLHFPATGTSQAISTRGVSGEDLRAAVYVLVRNNGAALKPGRYQASVIGTNNKIYRTVEFTVRRPAPKPAKRPTQPGAQPANPSSDGPGPTEDLAEARSTHRLNQFGFDYPARYIPTPMRRSGENAVVLRDTSPDRAMFVSLRNTGSFSLERDGNGMRDAVLKEIRVTGFTSWRAFSLNPETIDGRQIRGKVYVCKAGGRTCQVVVQSVDVDGTSFLVGHASILNTTAKAAPSSAVGGGGQVAEDAIVIVRTLRRLEQNSSPASQAAALARR